MSEVIQSYNLYRHRSKPNKWKVQYIKDLIPCASDWALAYKVKHIDNGKVVYSGGGL